MAHKKSGGSSRNGRDSPGQRLGVKKYGGEAINAGQLSWQEMVEQIDFYVQSHLR